MLKKNKIFIGGTEKPVTELVAGSDKENADCWWEYGFYGMNCMGYSSDCDLLLCNFKFIVLMQCLTKFDLYQVLLSMRIYRSMQYKG